MIKSFFIACPATIKRLWAQNYTAELLRRVRGDLMSEPMNFFGVSVLKNENGDPITKLEFESTVWESNVISIIPMDGENNVSKPRIQ